MVGSTQWTTFGYTKSRPLRSTITPNLAEPPNLKGLSGLQALHVHTKYTAGVQLCLGVGLYPKSQVGAVYAHAEATQALQWKQEAAPLWTLPRGEDTPVHPCVRFSTQDAPKTRGFFPQKSALRTCIWWFSHPWTISWESCGFSTETFKPNQPYLPYVRRKDVYKKKQKLYYKRHWVYS